MSSLNRDQAACHVIASMYEAFNLGTIIASPAPVLGAFGVDRIDEAYEISNGLMCSSGALLIRFVNATDWFLFVAGTSTRRHGYNVGEGYRYTYVGNDPEYSASYGCNLHLYSDGAAIHSRLIRERVPEGAAIGLYGHSAGGAIVELIAGRMMTRTSRRVINVTTYGAPKPGFSHTCNEATPYRRRYMVNGDPIPGLPAVARGSVLFELACVGLQSWVVPSYAHGSGGVRLSNVTQAGQVVGVVQENQQDATFAGTPVPQWENWLAGRNPGTQEHSITTYANMLARLLVEQRRSAELRRLQEIAAEMQRGPRSERTATQDEPRERFLVPELNNGVPSFMPRDLVPELVIPSPPISNAAAPMVVPGNITEAQTGPRGFTPATVMENRVVFPDGSTVAAERGRRIVAQSKVEPWLQWSVIKSSPTAYNVFWADYLIATCTKRSAARTLCRRGNALLRQMGNNGSIAQTAFLGAWAFFLDAAAAGNGYHPPLNVTP